MLKLLKGSRRSTIFTCTFLGPKLKRLLKLFESSSRKVTEAKNLSTLSCNVIRFMFISLTTLLIMNVTFLLVWSCSKIKCLRSQWVDCTLMKRRPITCGRRENPILISVSLTSLSAFRPTVAILPIVL